MPGEWPGSSSLKRLRLGCEGCQNRGVVYYPFGLTFNSYNRENSVENRYLYNQGTGEKTFHTERQFDLGLNVDQSKYRTYDYITGRWWQLDPLADEGDLVSITPNNYSFNNPVRYNDPEGDCPNCVTAAIGAGIGALIGGGIEAATQLYESGEITDWGAVGGSAAQGFVTGGAAGFTGGASLVVTAGVSAGANVAGGAINNAVQGKEITVGSVAKDAAVGLAAGVGGKILDKVVNKGVVYLRTDATGGLKPYVGQAKNAERYAARQAEHARANPKADFSFKKIDKGRPGKDLNLKEQKALDARGGPTNKSNPNGGTSNKKNVIKKEDQ